MAQLKLLLSRECVRFIPSLTLSQPSSISPLICPVTFPKSQFSGEKKHLLLMRAGERLINADESLLSCTSVSGETVV